MPDNLQIPTSSKNLRITWNHNPYIAGFSQRSGQCRRHGGEAPYPYEVIEFRSYKEYSWMIHCGTPSTIETWRYRTATPPSKKSSLLARCHSRFPQLPKAFETRPTSTPTRAKDMS
jgi:hypothetical protein